MNIDLSTILRQGDKTLPQVYNEIKSNPEFCRDEFGIEFSHFKSLISSDVSIYASINGNIAGLLSFMFLQHQGKRFILFNGICSPKEYSGMGVGNELINTLIRIGKAFDINFIKLECKGDKLMNYYKKFGFTVTSTKTSYDSDADDSDDSDTEDAGHLYYNMELDLSNVTGGKKKRKTLKKSRREKRKNTRRKLRKYKYH